MELKTATDWPVICTNLHSDLATCGYNRDLLKVIVNITTMVMELSKKEVECRRLNNTKALVEPLAKINTAIKHVEQFILMARLMK